MTLTAMIAKMSQGLVRTTAIFFLTLLFSLPLGLIVALLPSAVNSWPSFCFTAYVWLVFH